MRVFAISDLHLSTADPKPMNIFGKNWHGHPDKIFENWQNIVSDDDFVLVPGDISWAMHLKDALLDLQILAELPGKKILLRGNHDYWWTSLTKMQKSLPKDFFVIQNNAYRFTKNNDEDCGFVVCGTRGWDTPSKTSLDEQDNKILLREVQRLELSIKAAQNLKQTKDKLIIMLHYPPKAPPYFSNILSDLIEKTEPDLVVYGHLHNIHLDKSLKSIKNISCKLVSCDVLKFVPELLYKF